MNRLSLPWRDWPGDLQARWTAAVTPANDVFGNTGRGYHWAEDNKNVTRKRVELFFGFLVSNGLLEARQPLSRYLTEETLRPWIASFGERLSQVTVAGYVRDVHIGLRAMDPTIDDSVIVMIARRLERRAQPKRDKSGLHFHPNDIYRAGLDRMDRVQRDAYEKEDVRAVQYGDGLAIAIVTATNIRIKNLVGIRIGKELRRDQDGYHLVFAAKHMKSRRAFAADLPASLTPYLETYMGQHRVKLLGGQQSDHLFISSYRGPMSRQTMHIRFKGATEKELGIAFGPHRVRDFGVTQIAIDHPEKIGIAPQLLNHAKLRTTQKHYNQAGQLLASRKYNAELARLRREAHKALKKGKLFDHEPVD